MLYINLLSILCGIYLFYFKFICEVGFYLINLEWEKWFFVKISNNNN